MLALSLIIIGIALRLVTHEPNFTPVAAIALFSGVYLNKKYSLIVPLALMILSDLIIGLHNVVFFTWVGFGIVALIGLGIKKHKNLLAITSASLASSLLFYVITNFGVWLMGWYPHTLEGLISCFTLALPFFRMFTISTVIYTFVFFASYELVMRLVKNTKLAKVLLSDF